MASWLLALALACMVAATAQDNHKSPDHGHDGGAAGPAPLDGIPSAVRQDGRTVLSAAAAAADGNGTAARRPRIFIYPQPDEFKQMKWVERWIPVC